MTNNKPWVLATIVSVFSGFIHFSVRAEGPAPADPTRALAQREIIAPVEPRYEDLQPRSGTLMAEPQAVCDMDGYAQKSGQALVEHILASDNSCINNLYTGNPTSFASFTRQKMIDAASAAAQMAGSYTAATGDSSINKLYYFLRTGYYIEYNYPDDIQPFNPDVQNAVTSALDAFVSNGDFYTASDSHGQAITDAIVLMDSAGEQHRYLPVVKEWLSRWSQVHAQHSNMRKAVNGIFTTLFRGHWNNAFLQATSTDQQLMQRLGSFARSDWMLGSGAQFMQENAARELSRFLQYTSAPVYPVVKSEVAAVLERYSMTGTGSRVWLLVAGNADYFGQCAEFSICGFLQDLEQQVLKDRHTCSDSLRIHAQDMTAPQMSLSCDQLEAQESHFHQLLATHHNPVADDYNTDLEVVVFDDWSQYDTYAPFFYGISTNNGGMYLEGNPADPDNQARFIAHEADWLRPEFEVWNLTHEYVHYLDGRFNLYGGFADARTSTHKTVWWIEGLAEYVSKRNFNDAAIALARSGQYNLSQIFANTYSSDTERVYRWGYLAVRFMFERRRDDVTQLLSYLRAGNYDGYLAHVNGIGSSYDSEWQSWLMQVESTEEEDGGNEIGNNQEITGLALATTGSDMHFYIDLPAQVSRLSVAISGGSGDADLYLRHASQATDTEYACRPYLNGNNELCEIENPQAGRWYIRLKAYRPFADVSLLASFTSAVDACTGGTPLEYGMVELDTPTCLAGGNGIRYFYTYVPTGTQRLELTLSGGSGNADLYVNAGTWATASSYDQRSSGPGNEESLTVNAPPSGWYYISLIGSEYSETTIHVTR